MKRPKKPAAKKAAKPDVNEHVTTRLAPETLARVDALVAKHTGPWIKATRAGILRACVVAGLPAIEAQPKRGEA